MEWKKLCDPLQGDQLRENTEIKTEIILAGQTVNFSRILQKKGSSVKKKEMFWLGYKLI